MKDGKRKTEHLSALQNIPYNPSVKPEVNDSSPWVVVRYGTAVDRTQTPRTKRLIPMNQPADYVSQCLVNCWIQDFLLKAWSTRHVDSNFTKEDHGGDENNHSKRIYRISALPCDIHVRVGVRKHTKSCQIIHRL